MSVKGWQNVKGIDSLKLLRTFAFEFVEILKTDNRKGYIGLLGAYSAYLFDKYKP